MLSAEHANSTGNERFTGYIPELMQQLAHVVGFKYRLSLVDDASYGLPQRGGSWNGLIGQLLHDVSVLRASQKFVRTNGFDSSLCV